MVEGSSGETPRTVPVAEDLAREWAQDVQRLRALAGLSGVRPLDLLRKIRWAVGESTDTASFRRGQPLSLAARARLQVLLKERLNLEQEIIENCCRLSSQVAHLVPIFVGLAATSLVLFH